MLSEKDYYDIGYNMHGHGRRKILIPKPDVINKETLSEAIRKAEGIHQQISNECNYLWNYYRGKQPVLCRKKKVREDILNKIVVNHAFEIVTFKNGYVFGDPVQYVQRGKKQKSWAKKLWNAISKSEGNKESLVAPLNDLMQNISKPKLDKSLGKWMHVTGIGYRMILPHTDKNKIVKIATLDPRFTFVVYDTDIEETPWLCGKYFIDEKDGVEYKKLCCYTESKKIIFDMYESKEKDSVDISNTYYGFLPIIEYELNEERQGCFENAMDQMNEINTIESNVADLVEQNVQHLIVYKNCDIDTDKHNDFMLKGAIKITDHGSREGDVKVLKVDMSLSEIQQVIDAKYDSILKVCSVPDRNASSGGNTGTSIQISQGWQNAESCAKDTVLMYEMPEYTMFLPALIRIIKDSSAASDDLKKLTLDDIGIQFTRNRTDNYLVKTQGLLSELQAGIHPRQALIDCGLFSDPEQAFVDSEEILTRKWIDAQTSEQEVDTSQQKKVETPLDVLEKPKVTT